MTKTLARWIAVALVAAGGFSAGLAAVSGSTATFSPAVDEAPTTLAPEVTVTSTTRPAAAAPAVDAINREVQESARRPAPAPTTTTAPAPRAVAQPVDLPTSSTAPSPSTTVPTVPGAAPRPAGELPPGYARLADGTVVKVPMGYVIGPDGKIYPATQAP